MTDGRESRPGRLRARLDGLPADIRAAELLATVRAMAASQLQLADPQLVGADVPWTDLGFDSLRAVDLRSALAHELDLPLRSTLLFDQPQPRALVEHLLSLLYPKAVTAVPGAQRADAKSEIAIVGAACRFPGADGLDAFWQLLVEGRDAVRPIPRDRFDVDALFDADPAAVGKLYVREAGLLDDLAGFDAALFGISPREAQALDPQHRLLLETCWHALEHANLPPQRLRGTRVGVYVGIRSGEYFDSQTARTPADADAWYHTGNALSTAAGRIAYTFGFHGPCYAIDTACSGSLVAVHTAVRALRSGECDVALVAGVNAILDPVGMAGLCRARMLSPDGRCKTFDASADGYGRGEGCAVLVLRRLDDAERAGDRVFARVLGTAINQDGRSSGLTVPHGPSQQEVIELALADAGIDADAIDFVEAHGTGTALGDPIEVAALDAAFATRTRPLPVGSVKTSIGHLEAAAGIAGVMKTVLALRARAVPANLHFREPNPHVDWDRSRVRVVARSLPLPSEGVLHAGVSSFGFSGTNAHVVLGSTPVARHRTELAPATGRAFLLPLQAMDPAALRELARRHAEALPHGEVDLATWCRTAAVARQPLPVRAAFVEPDAARMVRALREFADGKEAAAAACARPAHVFDGAQTSSGAASADDPSTGTAVRELVELATRWVRGEAVDLALADPAVRGASAELPLYPFQRRRHWHTRVERTSEPPSRSHALLGERRESSLLAAGQSLFANNLSALRPNWLGDHRVDGAVLLPATAMVELAAAADLAHGRTLPLVVQDVAVRAPLVLGDTPVTIEVLRTEASTTTRFELRARTPDGAWNSIADAVLGGDDTANATEPESREAVAARCRTSFDVDALYARCAAVGLAYGPLFRAVRSVHLGDGELLATVRLPDALTTTGFALHPVLFDACWHAVVALWPNAASPLLPAAIERVVVHRRDARDLVCHARIRTRSAEHCVVDCVVTDPSGRLVARLDGLQSMAASPSSARRTHPAEWLHHVAFERLVLPPAPGPLPRRIALLGWQPLAASLLAALPKGTAVRVDGDALQSGDEPYDLVLWLAEPTPAGATTDFVLQRFDAALDAVQQALRTARPPRLCLVTHGAMPAVPSPAGPMPYATTLLGLWRTLAHEHAATRPFAIDLDPLLPPEAVDEHAAALAAELRTNGVEPEIALRHGHRFARRLRRGAAPSTQLAVPEEPFCVRTETYGTFAALRCLPMARRAPARGEIEVEVVAAAANFKDVLYVRGMLQDHARREGVESALHQPLGFEFSGRITAVGDGVPRLRVGDLVAGIAKDCFASHVTVAADAVFCVPEDCDPTEVAGMPIVFATAIHALLERAAVQPGETVLVHAAAGGVGQAAIQVLRDRDCRVLATCSRQKQAFVRSLGVEVVGDSRALDFGPAIAQATNGRGVDVVLNVLNGDGVAASLATVRRGGRFVELGKLGVWTEQQVRTARPDVQYCQFDLGDEFAADAQRKPHLLARLERGLREGRYRPTTTTVLPLASLALALLALAKGETIGKLVLTTPTRDRALRSDRTYLLTGASGGTARAFAEALVDAGARHLALLARSPIPHDLLAALLARGCGVTTLAADVCDAESLAAALHHLRATGPPLGGLVHAAGALADATLLQLDAAFAHEALRAKVTGTVLLDRLTRDDPLSFFALTGSMAGTLGSSGQAAYAAANAFLEAFAAQRRARGRPAVCVAFGPLDGAGMTGRLGQPLRRRLQRRGITRLDAKAAARLLTDHRDAPNDLAVLPIRWPEWLAGLGETPPPTFAELQPARAKETPIERIDLPSIPPHERRGRLRRLVAEQIAAALGFADADAALGDRAFRDLGLDSLLAMEAKERLEDLLGMRLPATLLFDFPDLDALVAHLASRT